MFSQSLKQVAVAASLASTLALSAAAPAQAFPTASAAKIESGVAAGAPVKDVFYRRHYYRHRHYGYGGFPAAAAFGLLSAGILGGFAYGDSCDGFYNSCGYSGYSYGYSPNYYGGYYGGNSSYYGGYGHRYGGDGFRGGARFAGGNFGGGHFGGGHFGGHGHGGVLWDMRGHGHR